MTAKIYSDVSQEIRSAVESEIGAKTMRDFELWAFHQSPAKYDGDIAFMFEKYNSARHELSSNNLEALSRIIHLWKHRNDWKMGGS
jgi:hypothetical protein